VRRMISGLVLKYLNGECFVIRQAYETTLPVSTSFCLTVPSWLFADIGGEVTHCNAAFLKPPSVSRLVAWQIDPGHLTSFLEERGS
ncbi:MAG: hypothetical protein ABF254_14460, partial [Octadecabacter sp.]